MEWETSAWPLITRKRYNTLVLKYKQLELDMAVVVSNAEAEQDYRRRAVQEVIEAKKTIQELRMKLIEANAELMEYRMRSAL